jgi:phage terminase small subunit
MDAVFMNNKSFVNDRSAHYKAPLYLDPIAAHVFRRDILNQPHVLDDAGALEVPARRFARL